MRQRAIRGFDWDRGNRDKCQKHGMSIAEIEAVFTRSVVVPGSGEPLGRAPIEGDRNDAGGAARLTWRSERDGAALLRPISARFMHRKEVESYEKAYPDV